MLALVAALGGACGPTEPRRAAAWGSDSVSVSIAHDTATVHLMASGGCYGSYGLIYQAIPYGTFSLPGSYVQLTGAYPGSRQYTAEYDGTLIGNTLTLSIVVPELLETIGPFRLTSGVTSTWPACLYP